MLKILKCSILEVHSWNLCSCFELYLERRGVFFHNLWKNFLWGFNLILFFSFGICDGNFDIYFEIGCHDIFVLGFNLWHHYFWGDIFRKMRNANCCSCPILAFLPRNCELYCMICNEDRRLICSVNVSVYFFLLVYSFCMKIDTYSLFWMVYHMF